MDIPFDTKTFLTCPQGPRLKGNARDRACKLLGDAIEQGYFVTAARLLMQDPSLITESLLDADGKKESAVLMAIRAKMAPLVLFALEHGISPESWAFGVAGGLFTVAVKHNSPMLLSCALLYTSKGRGAGSRSKWSLLLKDALLCACTNVYIWDRAYARQLTRMLLDAGADPFAESRCFTILCDHEWPKKEADEYADIFAEILKRGGPNCANMEIDGEPVIKVMIQSGNFAGVKQLILAGANLDPDFLGGDLFDLLRDANMSAHNGEANLAIWQREESMSGPPSPFTDKSTLPEWQLNVAPEGFLHLPQGERLVGVGRDTGRRLLEMAITQGKFVTATKVLARDPSLITETLGDSGTPQLPAVNMVIAAGMHALVPFALNHGVGVDDPSFGAQLGLLDVAEAQCYPGLAGYALLFGADPNPPNLPSFLDRAVTQACSALIERNLHDTIAIAAMLLDAETKSARKTGGTAALGEICAINWTTAHEKFDAILARMIDLGGPACVDMRRQGKPILRLVAETGKIAAVKQLIMAGASTDKEFLGVEQCFRPMRTV